MMLAYRKFTDASFAPPKPAKAPKIPLAGQNEGKTLDSLGALAELALKNTNFAPSRSAAERAFATWGDVQNERAAIVEHDGGIPRAWAEGFARLDPDRPPGDVPPTRWQRFVDDVGIFLDHWATYAAALGWGPHDLFGCDRDRPFAGIDQAGLLWRLNGDRLLALTQNTATIETRTGARQTYRLKPAEPYRALVWELASSAKRTATFACGAGALVPWTDGRGVRLRDHGPKIGVQVAPGEISTK
jgi:hypothetical protein